MAKTKIIPWTQVKAWVDLQPMLSKRQFAVASRVALKPMAAYEIARCLMIGMHQVSGRIKELVDSGVLVDSGQVSINPQSGKPGIVWQMKPGLDARYLS